MEESRFRLANVALLLDRIRGAYDNQEPSQANNSFRPWVIYFMSLSLTDRTSHGFAHL